MPKYKTELLQQLTTETVQQKIYECTARMDKEGFTLVSFSFMDAQTQKRIEGQYAVTIML